MVQPQTVPNGKDPDSKPLRLVSLQRRDQSPARVIIDPWAPGVTLVVFTLRDPNSKRHFRGEAVTASAPLSQLLWDAEQLSWWGGHLAGTRTIKQLRVGTSKEKPSVLAHCVSFT